MIVNKIGLAYLGEPYNYFYPILTKLVIRVSLILEYKIGSTYCTNRGSRYRSSSQELNFLGYVLQSLKYCPA
jgi:hypothetical protein